MSKSQHGAQQKREKTIFPADFFQGSRTSDPGKKYHIPRVSMGKDRCTVHRNLMYSPKKEVLQSESTSDISRESISEENIKLPEIRRKFDGEKLVEFKFPYQKDKSQKVQKSLKSTQRENSISRSVIVKQADDISPVSHSTSLD